MEGDTYINDGLHYELSVIQKVLVPDVNEENNGRWYWLHGECVKTEHPEEARGATYIRAES